MIYIFRPNTVQPFTNGTHSERALQWLFEQATQQNGTSMSLADDASKLVRSAVDRFRRVQREGTLLRLPFTTVFEYMWVRTSLLINKVVLDVVVRKCTAISSSATAYSVKFGFLSSVNPLINHICIQSGPAQHACQTWANSPTTREH